MGGLRQSTRGGTTGDSYAVIYLHISTFYYVGKIHMDITPIAQKYKKIFKTDSAQRSSNKCKIYLLKNYSYHGNIFNAI